MAQSLNITGSGQTNLLDTADKLDSLNNIASMAVAAAISTPATFPDDWYSFIYCAFTGVSPLVAAGIDRNIDVDFKAFGTPVFTASEVWCTPPTGVLTAGNGVARFDLTKNLTGILRSCTLTMTVTQPLGTYIVTITLNNEAATLYPSISLGLDASTGNAACSDFINSPVTRYIDTASTLCTTNNLWLNIDGTTNAGAGYYSDGSSFRYWNGSSWTGACSDCTI